MEVKHFLAYVSLAVAFLVIATAIMLHRTYGMREVIEPTPEWRRVNDARIDRVEKRLDALTTQAREVDNRANNLERMFGELREARHGR